MLPSIPVLYQTKELLDQTQSKQKQMYGCPEASKYTDVSDTALYGQACLHDIVGIIYFSNGCNVGQAINTTTCYLHDITLVDEWKNHGKFPSSDARSSMMQVNFHLYLLNPGGILRLLMTRVGCWGKKTLKKILLYFTQCLGSNSKICELYHVSWDIQTNGISR